MSRPKEEYREGVSVDKPKSLKLVYGPVCIGGDEYTVWQDIDLPWYDFRYGIYRLAGQPVKGFDHREIVTTALTLWGAKLYIRRLWWI